DRSRVSLLTLACVFGSGFSPTPAVAQELADLQPDEVEAAPVDVDALAARASSDPSQSSPKLSSSASDARTKLKDDDVELNGVNASIPGGNSTPGTEDPSPA